MSIITMSPICSVICIRVLLETVRCFPQCLQSILCKIDWIVDIESTIYSISPSKLRVIRDRQGFSLFKALELAKKTGSPQSVVTETFRLVFGAKKFMVLMGAKGDISDAYFYLFQLECKKFDAHWNIFQYFTAKRLQYYLEEFQMANDDMGAMTCLVRLLLQHPNVALSLSRKARNQSYVNKLFYYRSHSIFRNRPTESCPRIKAKYQDAKGKWQNFFKIAEGHFKYFTTLKEKYPNNIHEVNAKSRLAAKSAMRELVAALGFEEYWVGADSNLYGYHHNYNSKDPKYATHCDEVKDNSIYLMSDTDYHVDLDLFLATGRPIIMTGTLPTYFGMHDNVTISPISKFRLRTTVIGGGVYEHQHYNFGETDHYMAITYDGKIVTYDVDYRVMPYDKRRYVVFLSPHITDSYPDMQYDPESASVKLKLPKRIEFLECPIIKPSPNVEGKMFYALGLHKPSGDYVIFGNEYGGITVPAESINYLCAANEGSVNTQVIFPRPSDQLVKEIDVHLIKAILPNFKMENLQWMTIPDFQPPSYGAIKVPSAMQKLLDDRDQKVKEYTTKQIRAIKPYQEKPKEINVSDEHPGLLAELDALISERQMRREVDDQPKIEYVKHVAPGIQYKIEEICHLNASNVQPELAISSQIQSDEILNHKPNVAEIYGYSYGQKMVGLPTLPKLSSDTKPVQQTNASRRMLSDDLKEMAWPTMGQDLSQEEEEEEEEDFPDLADQLIYGKENSAMYAYLNDQNFNFDEPENDPVSYTFSSFKNSNSAFQMKSVCNEKPMVPDTKHIENVNAGIQCRVEKLKKMNNYPLPRLGVVQRRAKTIKAVYEKVQAEKLDPIESKKEIARMHEKFDKENKKLKKKGLISNVDTPFSKDSMTLFPYQNWDKLVHKANNKRIEYEKYVGEFILWCEKRAELKQPLQPLDDVELLDRSIVNDNIYQKALDVQTKGCPTVTGTKASSFVKLECYDGPKDCRMITQQDHAYLVELSRFTIPVKHHVLKKQLWYCPGMNGTEMTLMMKKFQATKKVAATDFSRFDGTQGLMIRKMIERAFYLHFYRHLDCDWDLSNLFAMDFDTVVVAKCDDGVLTYSTGGSRQSGSGLTADGNSINNAGSAYVALRDQGMSPEVAWLIIEYSMFYGDDGLLTLAIESYKVDPKLFEQTMLILGLDLKLQEVDKRRLPFLSRLFDPYNFSSVPDLKRCIPKMFVWYKQDKRKPIQQVFDRLLGYYIADPEHPVIKALWVAIGIPLYRGNLVKLDVQRSHEEVFKLNRGSWPQGDATRLIAYQCTLFGIPCYEQIIKQIVNGTFQINFDEVNLPPIDWS